ncbi:NUDIX hydrolase [Roseomonas elaeocarpi]|uniref:DUF4743 domain-containing protein n=1 Tax=Roseomonas elaeocarpi TaxID=907779 RepID=A0ABV6JSU2_9PROT
MDHRFLRHIEACNNAESFGDDLPLRVAGQVVGWLPPRLAEELPLLSPHLFPSADGVALDPSLPDAEARTTVLSALTAELVRLGRLRLRDEPFDVRATPDGPVLARIDRAAVAFLGILSRGAHLNGLVRRADGLHLWVGWRARNKALAPGKLDNVVAGGVPAGLSPTETLLKEAEEEASMPRALATKAREVGAVSYVMRNEGEGLRRDILHCFDLELPEDFTPVPGDDEVERFELWPARRVLEAVRDGDAVKFNVSLVLIDLFLREGMLDDEDGALRRGLSRFR